MISEIRKLLALSGGAFQLISPSIEIVGEPQAPLAIFAIPDLGERTVPFGQAAEIMRLLHDHRVTTPRRAALICISRQIARGDRG